MITTTTEDPRLLGIAGCEHVFVNGPLLAKLGRALT